jgi:hemerythrin-like domain-containing protein
MHALDLLAQQHREVSSLFEQLRAARSQDDRVRLLGRLAEALTLHAAIEERHFYPLVESHGLPEAADQARREHDEVRELVGRLMEVEQHSPEITPLLERLEVAVRDHVNMEENDLFVWVRGRVGEGALQALGEAMARTAEELRDQGLLRMAERREAPGLA